MLEKNGNLTLSSQEIQQIQQGTVPERLVQEWGLTLEELRSIIASHQYTLS